MTKTDKIIKIYAFFYKIHIISANEGAYCIINSSQKEKAGYESHFYKTKRIEKNNLERGRCGSDFTGIEADRRSVIFEKSSYLQICSF